VIFPLLVRGIGVLGSIISTYTVKAGDKGEVQLTLHADKDAALGDQKIMLKGTPDQGEAVELELKVSVTAK